MSGFEAKRKLLKYRFDRHIMATKMSLESKHLGNGNYFVIFASSSHPLLLTENAANGLVEAPLKKI